MQATNTYGMVLLCKTMYGKLYAGLLRDEENLRVWHILRTLMQGAKVTHSSHSQGSRAEDIANVNDRQIVLVYVACITRHEVRDIITRITDLTADEPDHRQPLQRNIRRQSWACRCNLGCRNVSRVASKCTHRHRCGLLG